jgi:hypothetical protein
MEQLFFFFPAIIYPFFLAIVLIKNIRQTYHLGTGKISWQDIRRHNWVEFGFIIIAPISGLIKLWLFSSFGDIIPFALPYAYALIPIYLIATISFYISRFSLYKENLPVYWISRAGIILGIIFCVVLSIHFGYYILLGIIFPVYGFEFTAPIVVIVYFIKELKRSRLQMLSITENYQNDADADIKLLPYLLRASPPERSLIIISLLVSILAMLELAILMSGLSPLSLILAFRESSSFLFSSNFF